MATAAPPLAFPPQPWRLRRLLWHFRRNLGDCGASVGVSAATLTTAALPSAFPPQPWRLRRFLRHFRRNVGDCGAFFGISAATLATAALPLAFRRNSLAHRPIPDQIMPAIKDVSRPDPADRSPVLSALLRLKKRRLTAAKHDLSPACSFTFLYVHRSTKGISSLVKPTEIIAIDWSVSRKFFQFKPSCFARSRKTKSTEPAAHVPSRLTRAIPKRDLGDAKLFSELACSHFRHPV